MKIAIKKHMCGISRDLRVPIIVVNVGVLIAVLYFHNRIPAFNPRHTMISLLTADAGHLLDYSNVERTPARYVAGAIVSTITGMGAYEQSFYPIFLIATSSVTYHMIYIFSKSHVFTSFIVLGYLTSGLDGRQSLFGDMSYILLFTMIIVSYLYLRDSEKSKGYFVTLSILSITLLYMNYNRAAIGLLFLVFVSIYVVIIITFNSRGSARSSLTDILRKEPVRLIGLPFMFIAIISSAILVYFHYFFDIVIPYYTWAINRGYSGIDIFTSIWLSSDSSNIPVGDLVFQSPHIITQLSGVRYMFILISLLIFTYFSAKNIVGDDSVRIETIILLAFTSGSAGFAIIKIFTGSLTITSALLPGMLATGWILHFSSSIPASKFKNAALTYCSIFLIIFILSSTLYYPIALNNDMVSDSKVNFERTSTTAEWHENHAEQMVRPDEFTSNLFRLHTSDELESVGMNSNHVLQLVNRKKIDGERLYVLNHNVNRVYIGGWQRIKPWKDNISVINSNPNVNKVYTKGDIDTYRATP